MWKTKVILGEDRGSHVDISVGESVIRITRTSLGSVKVIVDAPKHEPIVRHKEATSHDGLGAVE
jgi:sRNA-binding carbon storage regulator CsrA